jgi:uncharacterized protein (TIGR00251 family)
MTGYILKNGRVETEIKALPGASRSEFAGTAGGRLRIRIAAAPEDGKANEELRRFMAKALGCPRNEVSLIRGEKSRVKILGFPETYLERFKKITAEVPGK